MTDDATHTEPKPPPVDRMSRLWQRINEHKIVQWSVAYVALAYAVQHAVVLTGEAFEWPHIVQPISMLLLAFGAPVVMTFAWYHGQKANRHISGPELTIIALLLVTSSLLFYVFVKPGGEASAPASTAQQKTIPAPAGISLAVLPFVNLSSDKEQEFFSDGMTEEITAALAKIPDLRVVARTSAFEFKGKNVNIKTMGEQLGATHLIEGSVRKDGNQLRITAQLVRTDDGTHLWTENYDRQLKGVFAVQEEIAQAIAGALQVPLGLQKGQSLVPNRTNDLDAYQEYLRARAVFRARALDDAVQRLQSVVARDPNFAPAWGLLANVYGFRPYFNATLRSEALDKAGVAIQSDMMKGEAAAREAIRLDRRSSAGYAGLGIIQLHKAKWAEAEDLYKRAVELDPNDPDVLNLYSQMVGITGHIKASLPLREKLLSLEPFVPIFKIVTAGMMENNGDNDDAISLMEALGPEAGFFRNVMLARGYAARSEFEKAADTLLISNTDIVSRRSIEDAARLLRTPKRSESPQRLPVLEGELDFVYAYAGAPDRLMDFIERQFTLGVVTHPAESFWLPAAGSLRKTQKFKDYLQKIGLVGYWKVRGWPDLCHPTTGDDFVCE